jgi:hypothetical protein
MTSALNEQSLDQIFRSARTPNDWADRAVEDDIGEGGPATNAHCQPMPANRDDSGLRLRLWTGDSIHTESSRKYDAESFTRLAKLGGWDVAELWTDADRLFAVFGLVAAEPAQGS